MGTYLLYIPQSISMKTRVAILAGILMLWCIGTRAQNCSETLQVVTYDTVVYGSGNTFHSFQFPKFNSALGTLIEVKLESEITLTYNFQLENRENITINNYRVRVTREDEVSGPALVNPISNSQIRTYGPYSLTAWDGIAGSGSDYAARGPLYVMNHALVSQTVYNVADYLGPGSVDFDYATTTYSSVLGSVNYTFNATAQDTVRFQISYYYCATAFMAADISSFIATKKNESLVDLQWITLNEEKDRQYEIQKSYDGKNFETIDRRISQPDGNQTGAYRYSYALQQKDNHPKLIFRLKQSEKNAVAKYSALRVVDIRNNATQRLRAYPNPTQTHSQLVFSNQKRSNWDVEIFNSAGVRVKQYRFINALTGRLDGLQSLPPGMYFVKATNRNSEEVKMERLVVGK